MSIFGVDVKLDPASLDTLYAFEHYEAALEPALENAMDAGIAVLQATASDYMWSVFIHPTGNAEDDSWEVDIQSPYLAILGNTAPQAQRLEFGFSDMTDSLGRYYPLWPGGPRNQFWLGYHWANFAVMSSRSKIKDIFQAAIDYANSQLRSATP